ncbi:hypothetical protein A0J61_10609 [Choanephora cucurbitarum]|uniref:Uncharacterized protein n=1 Tax=Choanephora cucurbitarum TaxID=101091 RepID=A0A1C7MX04_9FUNG|nr:hypothetical protein A0J61_10609 [Choanephora cucurbitarum]
MQSARADEAQEELSDEDIDLVSDDEEVQQQEERANELLFRLETERLGEAVSLEEPEWNPFTHHFLPFKTIESMIMHVLMNGDNDMISERMMKKILYAFKLVLIVAEKAFKDKRRVRLPTLNELMRYQKNVNNTILTFRSRIITIDLDNNESANATINMPSDHLQLLAVIPKKHHLTPDQSTCLQQAGKWQSHPLFEQPMWSFDGGDVWSGDIVQSSIDAHIYNVLVESFHKTYADMFVKCYQLLMDDNSPAVYLSEVEVHVPVLQIQSIVFVDRNRPVFQLDRTMVSPKLYKLFTTQHHLKKQVEGSSGKYCKVKISPIILFTDDTSGNSSKQFNAYESWSMRCASILLFNRKLPLPWSSIKKNGVSGTSFLPALINDLKQLERGIKMGSAVDNEYVIVVAPLMWIEADSPCHSELCGLLGLKTLYSCRKCYVLLSRKKGAQTSLDHFIQDHQERTKERYLLAASTPNRTLMIVGAPGAEYTTKASDLSFKNRNTDSLLELESFDPRQDTPTEILHTVLLGIAKYLINDLVKFVLTDEQTKKVNAALDSYKSSLEFSRQISRNLNHCGFFLGRDYKSLLQILPVILTTEFPLAEDHLGRLIPCFTKLGKLCSLLFVGQMTEKFNIYVDEVDAAAKELIKSLYEYDCTCTLKKHQSYTLKPKVHFLTHLARDIRRFGTALNFETEKGEQFNKHIREYILHTNKVNVSNQIAVKFGKQSMIRHVVDANQLRVKAGYKILEFVQNQGNTFYHNLFRGTRDFADNNDNSYAKPNVKNGLFAVFKNKSNDSTRYIGSYNNDLITCWQVKQPTFENIQNNVLLAIQTFYLVNYNDCEIEHVLDMHTRYQSDQCRLINLNKFGTYWHLKYKVGLMDI